MPGAADDGERRVPELDGLRGVAIWLVLAHHYALGAPAASAIDRGVLALTGAGWIGVDLFFVLSGYLITVRLLAAKGSATYFRAFYARRALRIAPPYFLLLLGCFVIGPALGVRLAPRSAADAPWFWLYASNLLTVLHGWPDRALAHLWSLAIEEHFYLAWPLLILVLPARRAAAATLGVALASLVMRASALAHGLTGADVYVLTPTRLDGLAVGSTLAVLAHDGQLTRRLGGIGAGLAAGGLGLLTWAVASGRGHWGAWSAASSIWGFLVLALAGAGGLAWTVTADPGHPLRRALRARPLLAAGRLSYGLYLFHMPLVEIAHRLGWQPAALVPAGSPTWPWLVLYAAAQYAGLFVVAEFSYRLVEAPLLRLKSRFPYR